ncbi:MAG: AMP-binding protein [Candidatus Electrothrix sp. GW3-4]|uniref:AMP-binding protein n=1 Tax=Candidatus Electrothrix sp. GW3-4 TaxID=3126740 RepID=UPI0030CD00A9
MSKKNNENSPDIFFPVKEYREKGRATHLNALIDTICEKYKELPAVGIALEGSVSYQEFHDRILLLAALLRQAGVGPGDRVALLAESSPAWGIVYFAIIRLGAVCVPILPELPEEDVEHILTEMACETIFTTRSQIKKISIHQQLNRLITLDDHQDSALPLEVITFSELLSQARNIFTDMLQAGELQFPEPTPDQPASIMYTSGTSGFSKAVILSHKNFCANAYATDEAITLFPGVVFLSLLPLSHAYEFTTGFLMPLIKGASVLYVGKVPTPSVLEKICRQERPHALLVVPLIIEKIYKKQIVPALEGNALLSLVSKVSLGRRWFFPQIGARLHQFFGGRLVIMGMGGAALNPEVELFLRDAGFPFLVGYGLSEAAPLISGGPYEDSSILPGSVGKPVLGVEVRIAEPSPKTGIGEILVRGPNIMQGYWQNPQATEEVLAEDGWLRTGDLGCMDAQGNLCICGRSKSVIVRSNGENVYPEAIEHRLNSCFFVLDSLVIDNGSVLEAWLHLDYDLLAKRIGRKDKHDKCDRQYWQEHILLELEQLRKNVNKRLATASRLSAAFEHKSPFVKTATHKIKRYLYTAESLRKGACSQV